MARVAGVSFVWAVWAVCYVAGATSIGCGDFQMIPVPPLSCDVKQSILNRHNELRAQIAVGRVDGQPPAANMIEMTWDDDLAAMAQEWAYQCTNRHDPRRSIQKFTIGQNLARSWTTAQISSAADVTPDFPRQIDAWFNEVKKYRYGQDNDGTGHYTQVIWSDSYAVGCGFSMYYDRQKGYTKHYVCNYGPSGNMKGHHPYVSGYPSCGNYGMYDSYYYAGLCAKGVNRPLGAYC